MRAFSNHLTIWSKWKNYFYIWTKITVNQNCKSIFNSKQAISFIYNISIYKIKKICIFFILLFKCPLLIVHLITEFIKNLLYRYTLKILIIYNIIINKILN